MKFLTSNEYQLSLKFLMNNLKQLVNNLSFPPILNLINIKIV